MCWKIWKIPTVSFQSSLFANPGVLANFSQFAADFRWFTEDWYVYILLQALFSCPCCLEYYFSQHFWDAGSLEDAHEGKLWALSHWNMSVWKKKNNILGNSWNTLLNTSVCGHSEVVNCPLKQWEGHFICRKPWRLGVGGIHLLGHSGLPS